MLTLPVIGYRYRERPEIRVLLYGHYRIAYVISATRDVQVLGVFHGALDMGRRLSSGFVVRVCTPIQGFHRPQ